MSNIVSISVKDLSPGDIRDRDNTLEMCVCNVIIDYKFQYTMFITQSEETGPIYVSCWPEAASVTKLRDH